jgi:hypothetical protein
MRFKAKYAARVPAVILERLVPRVNSSSAGGTNYGGSSRLGNIIYRIINCLAAAG